MAATKDTDGRDDDMSINKTEVVFLIHILWCLSRDQRQRQWKTQKYIP